MSSLFPLNILSATAHLGDLDPAWTLTTPEAGAGESEGRRIYQTRVFFQTPFALAPVVHAAISGFDISDAANARLRVRAIDVTAEGFVLEVETWLNTIIWSVDVAWLAVGS